MGMIKLLITENLVYILALFLVVFGGQVHYLILKSNDFPYQMEFPEKTLGDKEEARLDNMLGTGRKFHYWSFIFTGILLALSALENVSEVSSPIGEISIPIVPTAVGLYSLVIITLIIADRFLILAYPWIALDNRRPPFDWIVFGFDFKNQINIGFWEVSPIILAAICLSIILKSHSTVSTVATTSVILFAGLTISQAPRAISRYYYLITKKLDHRGGNVTFSTYLLYIYRLLGIVLFSVIIAIPIILIIPQWYSEMLDKTLVVLLVIYFFLWIIRWICGIKKVYGWIDKVGMKFGFPGDSKHNKTVG